MEKLSNTELSILRAFQNLFYIMKTYLCNFDPLKPRFYRVYSKTGVYRGTHYFSYFCSKNIDCGYTLELLHWGSSNEYPQFMFFAEIWKISEFLSENFQFLVVKFSIYLNKRVFLMKIILAVIGPLVLFPVADLISAYLIIKTVCMQLLKKCFVQGEVTCDNPHRNCYLLKWVNEISLQALYW